MKEEILGRIDSEGMFIFSEEDSTIVARIDDDGIVRLRRGLRIQKDEGENELETMVR